MSRPAESVDAPFFSERDRLRRPGVTRSLARARAFAGELGVDLDGLRTTAWPVLAVVGSKGKGTAAVYASATLAAAGIRVGTLTSPGFVSHRERIRVDGAAISAADYARISARLTSALDRAGATLPGGGYLSPTGLFTLSAIRHFLDAHCDAVVLEAGMGGMSDEISLLDPAVVAVTAIFAEHLGILGDSITGIAANKLGIVAAATQAIATVAQAEAGVAEQVAATARGRRLHVVGAEDVPGVPWWPPALVGVNAQLGVVAAGALLDHLGVPCPSAQACQAVHATVRLPARLSVHRRGAQTWMVDAAINANGARSALAWFRATIGKPDTVVVSVPDDKDCQGVLAELMDCHVLPVRVAAAHLHFDNQVGRPLFADIDVDALGDRVLALGTISFAGEVLGRLGVDTLTAFEPPGQTAMAGAFGRPVSADNR